MMQGVQPSTAGVVRFFSKDELRRYLKSVVEEYQAQNQRLGDELGTLIRTLEQEKAAAKAAPTETKDSKGKDKAQNAKGQSKGWVKMGTLLVNTSDPKGAMAEVLFQLHEDVKNKLTKSTEALKSFEELNSQTIPEAGLYYLQIRNGVPEKIVADLSKVRREIFNFSGGFKLV